MLNTLVTLPTPTETDLVAAARLANALCAFRTPEAYHAQLDALLQMAAVLPFCTDVAQLFARFQHARACARYCCALLNPCAPVGAPVRFLCFSRELRADAPLTHCLAFYLQHYELLRDAPDFTSEPSALDIENRFFVLQRRLMRAGLPHCFPHELLLPEPLLRVCK